MTSRASAKQVAALPWRKRRGRLEVLLITSRETRRWVIPKGWPMARLIESNAAKREAYEEAGVEGTVRRRAIGRYTYDKRAKDGPSTRCEVTVFALAVARELRTWPERTERTRRWFGFNEAVEMVNEVGLRVILRTFAEAAQSGR